ncbi:MAG: FixH family protein [Rhodobacteraceae bacterium]|jgi:nitrogen fixation protein FixH|nr:FixH family protein [Paracoccaceae bacterium]
MAQREIKGKHVLMVFVAAFGVIISVNLFLAFSAVSTFPGLEVKNSYVASQTFDDRREAQEALGWTVRAFHEDGDLNLSIRDEAGRAVRVVSLDATVGRATHVQDDVTPDFQFDGVHYTASVPLSEGNWNIRMRATAQDGTEFLQRVVLIKE